MMYMEIVQPKVDHSKLVELGHLIKGTKAASSLNNNNDQLRASSSESESELESFLKRAELHRQRLEASSKTKGASSVGVTTAESYPEIKVNDQLSRATKLAELGKMIREYFD